VVLDGDVLAGLGSGAFDHFSGVGEGRAVLGAIPRDLSGVPLQGAAEVGAGEADRVILPTVSQ
jgi:hypothetical protein